MALWQESKVRFNARRTVYPDGSSLVMVSDRQIFRAPGWEAAGEQKPAHDAGWLYDFAVEHDPELHMAALEREGKRMELESWEAEQAQRREASQQRAMRRARSKVRDLARCNDFSFFVTLTLDPAKVDRYDIRTVTKKLNNWLDNAVRRRGLAYVLVPELHKDGAIHFHGFFNYALPVVDSGTLTNGGRPRRPRSAAERTRLEAAGWHVVYNLPGWPLGFSTAIELYGDRRAAVAYVCKYISKAAATTGRIGGRWYYSGGALALPRVEYFDADFNAALAAPGAYGAVLPELGAGLAIYQTDGGNNDV